jgi:hypothetical protein
MEVRYSYEHMAHTEKRSFFLSQGVLKKYTRTYVLSLDSLPDFFPKLWFEISDH